MHDILQVRNDPVQDMGGGPHAVGQMSELIVGLVIDLQIQIALRHFLRGVRHLIDRRDNAVGQLLLAVLYRQEQQHDQHDRDHAADDRTDQGRVDNVESENCKMSNFISFLYPDSNLNHDNRNIIYNFLFYIFIEFYCNYQKKILKQVLLLFFINQPIDCFK